MLLYLSSKLSFEHSYYDVPLVWFRAGPWSEGGESEAILARLVAERVLSRSADGVLYVGPALVRCDGTYTEPKHP
jgi:hypothetical protein